MQIHVFKGPVLEKCFKFTGLNGPFLENDANSRVFRDRFEGSVFGEMTQIHAFKGPVFGLKEACAGPFQSLNALHFGVWKNEVNN